MCLPPSQTAMAIDEVESSSPLPTPAWFLSGVAHTAVPSLAPWVVSPQNRPTHIIFLSLSMMLNAASDEGESVVQTIENYGISKMCYFCSRRLEYDFNFPEGRLSQLWLRLAIEKVHVSLTDPSSQRGGEGRGDWLAGQPGQDSHPRDATPRTPQREAWELASCTGVLPSG